MTKYLDIKLQDDYLGYLFYSFPLCMLEANESYTPWIMENYVNVYCNLAPFFVYADAVSYMHSVSANETVDFYYIPNGILPRQTDITAVINQAITEDFYVIVFLDEYYRPDSNNFQQKHFIHEILIYGVDHTHYSYLAFDKRGTFNQLKFPISELNKAYWNNPKYGDAWVNEHSLILMKPRLLSPIQFNFERFLEKYDDYLKCKPVCKEYFYNRDQVQYWGLESTIALYDFFSDNLTSDIYLIPPIHLWHEHKKGMLKKWNYIRDNNHYPTHFPIDDLIIAYEEISDISDKVRIQNMKYLKVDKENTKQAMLKNLKNVFEMEKKLLNKL